jgi:hypothetical protein
MSGIAKARKFAARTDEEFETFLGKALQKVSEGIEGRAPITNTLSKQMILQAA